MKNKARLIATVLSGGVVSIPELNASPDPITPTLGSELITNGGFDSDTTGWTAGGSGAAIASVSGGQSGNCLQVTSDLYAYGYQTLPALTVGSYYILTLYQKNGTANGLPRWGINPNGNDYAGLASNNANWTLKQYVARVTSATNNVTLIVNSASASQTALFDTVSCKLLTDTSVLVGDTTRKSGTYTCTPTVAQFSQCGMDINYLDANNLVRVVVDRKAGAVAELPTAKLLKRISGTWTEVISGAITYSAAAPLSVVVNGTDFSLYYNSTQVGSTQTIDNSGLGTAVYGFNTLAGNTVGTVTTNP